MSLLDRARKNAARKTVSPRPDSFTGSPSASPSASDTPSDSDTVIEELIEEPVAEPIVVRPKSFQPELSILTRMGQVVSEPGITFDVFIESIFLHFEELPEDEKQVILNNARTRRRQRLDLGTKKS